MTKPITTILFLTIVISACQESDQTKTGLSDVLSDSTGLEQAIYSTKELTDSTALIDADIKISIEESPKFLFPRSYSPRTNNSDTMRCSIATYGSYNKDISYFTNRQDSTIWIFTNEGKHYQGVFISSTTHPNFSGYQTFAVKIDSVVRGQFLLISDKPFPKQTWKELTPSHSDSVFGIQYVDKQDAIIREALTKAYPNSILDTIFHIQYRIQYHIIRTTESDFLILFYLIPSTIETQGEWVDRICSIFKKEGGNWQLCVENDGGYVFPRLFGDIDNDGFPEIVTGIDHSSYVISKLYKSSKTIASNGTW